MAMTFSTAVEGQFESFINDNSINEGESQIRKTILDTINNLAQSNLFPEMNSAALRGSSDKHTDIPNYSDMDIVVDCKRVITRRIRKDFLLELVKVN
jgi:DNA polymerase sigma